MGVDYRSLHVVMATYAPAAQLLTVMSMAGWKSPSFNKQDFHSEKHHGDANQKGCECYG